VQISLAITGAIKPNKIEVSNKVFIKLFYLLSHLEQCSKIKTHFCKELKHIKNTKHIKKTTYYGRVRSNGFCNFACHANKKDPYGVL
jgi:hypothetical protein